VIQVGPRQRLPSCFRPLTDEFQAGSSALALSRCPGTGRQEGGPTARTRGGPQNLVVS
jgi:hypothetical protein